MTDIKTINYEEFLRGYKSGELLVYVNKNKAGDFVLSKFGDKHNKPAHLFWSWTGLVLTFILPIILLFVSWVYSILSFVVGLMISNASRKSAQEFVMQNLLENEDFWDYTLMHGGAEIKDKEGNIIKSAFSARMENKNGK